MAKPRNGKRRHGDVDLLVALVLAAMLEDDSEPPPRATKAPDPRRPTGKTGNSKQAS